LQFFRKNERISDTLHNHLNGDNPMIDFDGLMKVLDNQVADPSNDKALERCVDLGHFCTTSTDCCGYPRAVCV